MAVPEDPSRARVSLIPGTTFSSRPRTNWMVASADRDVERRRLDVMTGVKALTLERTAGARARIDLLTMSNLCVAVEVVEKTII